MDVPVEITAVEAEAPTETETTNEANYRSVTWAIKFDWKVGIVGIVRPCVIAELRAVRVGRQIRIECGLRQKCITNLRYDGAAEFG